jgi:hypothetical protein
VIRTRPTEGACARRMLVPVALIGGAMKAAIASGALLLVFFFASDESAWAAAPGSANTLMPGCREILWYPNGGGTEPFLRGECIGTVKREEEEDWGDKRWGRGRRRRTNSK